MVATNERFAAARPQNLPVGDYYFLQDTYSAGTVEPNSRIYFLQDADWNTTAIVGLVGGNWQVVQRYVYSPYGTITILNADWSTPPAGTQPGVSNLYQGMTLDSVTGLYDERFRNYSPELGTWISQDPAGYINGANTYQFVGSAPERNVDPWGLAAGPVLAGAVVPAQAPGGPPGSGSVTVTGTTGPVATGIPGTTVTVGATGTASTGGGYTGRVTATGTVKTGGGSSVSMGITGTGSGKITKQAKSPTVGVQIKCQYKSAPMLGATLSPFAKYSPAWGGSPQYWQAGVNINLGNGLSVTPSYSSQMGGTLFIGIVRSW